MLTLNTSYKNRGFTLVELSIVLIIIGFIIAGVSAGMALVSTSKLRAVTTEAQTLQTGALTFTTTYKGFPGDMSNATTVLGTVDKAGNAINNGNGDGCFASCGSATINSSEVFGFFQQLAYVGLIPGIFTGVTDASSSNQGSTPGKNIPYSKYGGGYWAINSNYWGDYTMLVNAIGNTNNVLVNDAYYIDNKIDDGMPLTGSMIGHPTVCGANLCVNVNICSGSIVKSTPYSYGNAQGYCNLWYSVDGQRWR
jgi:prepilin-type N-terminal cleavage/methylation domain-containing protein